MFLNGEIVMKRMIHVREYRMARPILTIPSEYKENDIFRCLFRNALNIFVEE